MNVIKSLLKLDRLWTKAIERSMMEHFEEWYLEYHSTYPQMMSEEQIGDLKQKLIKSSGGYVNLDVHYEFAAYKQGRTHS